MAHPHSIFLTVSFHFLPGLLIGLAISLAVLEGLWSKTGKGVYANLYRYLLRIFTMTLQWTSFGHRHVLSVRNELAGVFGQSPNGHRSPLGR